MSTRSIGNTGENIACEFLESRGFVIVERNYMKKWGEIDIVAREKVTCEKTEAPEIIRKISKTSQQARKIHFFEVKSITSYVASSKTNSFRPEDNVHGLKVRHIGRMIETYMFERGLDYQTEIVFHVICVYINTKTRRAQVKWLKNIIL